MTTQTSQAVRVLRLSILAASIGLAMVPQLSQAQSAEGALYGQAKAGAQVTVINVETGQTRKENVSAGGVFRVSKLPPGRYKVTVDGVTREVEVTVGGATEVKLLDTQLESVTVRGNRVKVIDLTSSETSAVFTAEQIRELPVARTAEAVALLAPGVVKGDAGFGGMPSFSGASVAENGYYINGFDVTNLRTLLSYADLPYDAVAAQQVKSGGYGAEYGRSLGGVISLVTKRGTNEWKGGASLSWTPGVLRSKAKNIVDLDPDHARKDSAGKVVQPLDPAYVGGVRSASYSDAATVNLFAGGPIIKDKLFIFGLLESTRSSGDSYGTISSSHTDNGQTPRAIVKVDFQPLDGHTFEWTQIRNKTNWAVTSYQHPNNWNATSHLGDASTVGYKAGGNVSIFKYTGSLTDALTVSTLFGRVHDQPTTSTVGSTNPGCPYVYDASQGKYFGCWDRAFYLVRDVNAPPSDTDDRKAWRLDLEYALGNHIIRGGLDNQKYRSVVGGQSYSGGVYWRYDIASKPSSADPTKSQLSNGALVPLGTKVVRQRHYMTTSGAYEVENNAWYVEDSWQATKQLMLYGGLRGEGFTNLSGDGTAIIDRKNLIAPRLGFSWDPEGKRTSKVYGSLGRYYIPIAANTNVRLSRAESDSYTWHTYTGFDPVTYTPSGLSPQIGQTVGDPNLVLPNPKTLVDTKLKPMSQDELILGMQRNINKDWVFGVKGAYRKINDGMDDFCGGLPFEKWAKDNGYTSFDTTSLATCMVINPGKDVTLQLDVNGDGKLVEKTVPARYFDMAKYTRTYKALEFTLDHPFDGKWGGSFSYVLSRSNGTAEGYVQSTNQQDDPGATQDFDFASFTHGARGDLPNDRRHVFKLFGTYAVTDAFRVGFNATVASGRPLSCVGYVPPSVADYNPTADGKKGASSYEPYAPSSYYCWTDPEKKLSQLIPRGTVGRTPWTYRADIQLAYTPKLASGKLTLQMNIFNVLNSQKAERLNEFHDVNSTTKYINPNYLQPTNLQAPRSVNLNARYEF